MEQKESKTLTQEYAEMIQELKAMQENINQVIHPTIQTFRYEMLQDIMEEYKPIDIFGSLEEWREERGLTPENVKVSPLSTIKHMLSELEEGLEAIENGDFEGWIDAVIDAIIYGINGLELNNVDAEVAFKEVLKEISSRKGKYNKETQKFEKQITGEEYKADLKKAIRGTDDALSES